MNSEIRLEETLLLHKLAQTVLIICHLVLILMANLLFIMREESFNNHKPNLQKLKFMIILQVTRIKKKISLVLCHHLKIKKMLDSCKHQIMKV
jgi:hypothetical protein